jgi:hypothetical protein
MTQQDILKKWIAELEQFQQLLTGVNSPISDEDMIIHILNNLPEEYETVMEAMERQIDILLLPELKEELQNKYEKIIKQHKGKPKKEETALIAKKGFKGICRTCGKFGHKSADYWENKNKYMPDNVKNNPNVVSGGNKSTGTNAKSDEVIVCNYCKKGRS